MKKKDQKLYGPRLEYPKGYVSPITPEMIEHLKDCEAREWIKRRKEKMRTVGSTEALQWWQDHLTVMEKIRGASATLDLRQRIKRQMNENRT
jgi:hypothetical protein